MHRLLAIKLIFYLKFIPIDLFFIIFFFGHFSSSYGEIDELRIKIISVYPHNSSDFTQGLISDGDIVYESCGLYGTSCLKIYELKTGKLLKIAELPPHFFAEGIALNRDRLIQLTWKEKTAFVYNLQTFEIVEQFTYSGEGWGLCQEGDSIWMSNGTSQLFKRNSQTFKIQKTLSVQSNSQPQGFLNDLVCIANHIYINVLGSYKLLQVDKETGEVTAFIDASNLLSPQQKNNLRAGAVFNGIAYREDKQTFLVTGKFWPHIFEVVFEKKI